MTGYGFTGPMTARGTVFDDKAFTAGVSYFNGLTTQRTLTGAGYIWWLVLLFR